MITHRKAGLPQPLAKFRDINRYWDNDREIVVAKILPGEYYVTVQNEGVSTVLGSCVSACIRDRNLNIGGMNHFMLPEDRGSGEITQNVNLSASNRYGNYAMESLINDILKNGGKRSSLEVKIVGGGRILEKMTNIGSMNINFVKSYILEEGLSLVSEDVGDIFPRKVIYFPSSGKLLVKRLRSLHNNTIIERETSYSKSLAATKIGGDVELF